MSIRKIHISGGQGFIGSNISKSLGDIFDISVSDLCDTNVLNKEDIVDRIKSQSPDLIIALAGLMGGHESKLNLYNIFNVNSFGVLNVIEAAHLAAVKNIIFFSSLTVHGAFNNHNKIINENDKFLPAHPYSTSKVIAEYLLRDYSKFYKINVVILRPTIVVGNLLGEENALNEFTKNAFKGNPIVLYGRGKHKREYLSVSDLTKAVERSIKFLENNADENVCESFIISSGKGISMAELALNCVAIANGGSVKHKEKSSQAFSLLSNISKAKNKLEWEPMDDIDKMIKDMLSNIKADNNDNK
tara:strand:- start:275 stop:1180 length:906 start_codon:yes stop_codon:yes gene_type:complete